MTISGKNTCHLSQQGTSYPVLPDLSAWSG